jgi:membrane associated rhomboid family serine protease
MVIESPGGITAVFRSTPRGPCNERAFVLAAVGITADIVFDGRQFVLLVSEADASQALSQLAQYELERGPRRPAPPPLPNLPHAWVGCVIYAVTLVFVGLMISNGFWRLDAFDAGELDAARIRSGQWWRAWTALTLHLDGSHLIANLGAGIWFGHLAARQIGSGISWLLIVTGAALANLIEALLGPQTHQSVGVSTAVFTALGLLAAHSWRLRAPLIQQWAMRWAPLVAGVVLLGWFGAGDDDANLIGHTDVVAHVLGFISGILLGVLAARQHTRWLPRIPQWAAGLAALASIALAWLCALLS